MKVNKLYYVPLELSFFNPLFKATLYNSIITFNLFYPKFAQRVWGLREWTTGPIV